MYCFFDFFPFPGKFPVLSSRVFVPEGKEDRRVAVCYSLSHVRLFVTPWTVAHQTPLSVGFSRQEYWSGLPFPSPGDLLDPRIKPRSPALQADSLSPELFQRPGKSTEE